MRLVPVFVASLLTAVIIACGDGAPTLSVNEAIEQGYSREEEPCDYLTMFPELYEDVVYEELGDGWCAMYYPPR